MSQIVQMSVYKTLCELLLLQLKVQACNHRRFVIGSLSF